MTFDPLYYISTFMMNRLYSISSGKTQNPYVYVGGGETTTPKWNVWWPLLFYNFPEMERFQSTMKRRPTCPTSTPSETFWRASGSWHPWPSRPAGCWHDASTTAPHSRYLVLFLKTNRLDRLHWKQASVQQTQVHLRPLRQKRLPLWLQVHTNYQKQGYATLC